MKPLLILITILLLSSPVIGEETGVLYQYETSSGLVWKTFGDDKVQPKYKGEIKNGKPEGFGNLTSSDGEKYVGEWKDGKENGQGTTFLSDGGKYVGSFWNGKVFTGTRTDKNGKVIGKFYIGSESYTQFRNPQNRGEREWNSEMAADHEHE